MRSNINRNKSLNYYIAIYNFGDAKIDTKEQLSFLALDRNNMYCLRINHNNSRCIRFDNYTFAESWLHHNQYLFNNLIPHNSKVSIISIEEIKKWIEQS